MGYVEYRRRGLDKKWREENGILEGEAGEAKKRAARQPAGGRRPKRPKVVKSEDEADGRYWNSDTGTDDEFPSEVEEDSPPPARRSRKEPIVAVSSEDEEESVEGSVDGEGGRLRGKRVSRPLRAGLAVTGFVKEVMADDRLRVQFSANGKVFEGIAFQINKKSTILPKLRHSLKKRTSVPRVIVIGAGFAGLAAARELKDRGCEPIILEARDRVGGRCWTETVTVGGKEYPLDIGAGWIHGTEGNPITQMCSIHHVDLHHIHNECVLYTEDGQQVSKETDAAVEEYFNTLLERAKKKSDALGEDGGVSIGGVPLVEDVSLGQVIAQFVAEDCQDPAKASLFSSPHAHALINWHCANIEYSSAADINRLSVRFWASDDVTAFEGEHCLLKQGYGTLAKEMAKGLDIRFSAQVVKIVHDEMAGCVVALKNGEEMKADVVLVTIPLGLLKKEVIAFDPPLPEWKTSAIKRLGYGQLNKVFLVYDRQFWNIPTKYFGYASQRKGEYYMFVDLSDCLGMPILLILIPGINALDLEGKSDATVVAEATLILEKIVGKEVPNPLHHRVTRWSQDEFALGSYSYYEVGSTMRDVSSMGRPLDDNRVFFAGEATNTEYPSTAHGAYMSGIREARNILVDWNGGLPDLEFDEFVPADDELVKGEKRKCALCGGETSDLRSPEGILLGPVRINRSSVTFVHEQCACSSPEVGNDDGRWYNIAKAIRRGRRMKCSICKRNGATVGCFNSSCNFTFHMPCAMKTGWSFDKPEQGKMFYCQNHRTPSQITPSSVVPMPQAMAQPALHSSPLPSPSPSLAHVDSAPPSAPQVTSNPVPSFFQLPYPAQARISPATDEMSSPDVSRQLDQLLNRLTKTPKANSLPTFQTGVSQGILGAGGLPAETKHEMQNLPPAAHTPKNDYPYFPS